MANWMDYSTIVDGKTIRRHRYITNIEEPRLDGIARIQAVVLGGVDPATDEQKWLVYHAFVGSETRTFSQAMEAFTWVQNQAKLQNSTAGSLRA